MIGLDKFKEYFMGYQDQYVLIGGAACDTYLKNMTPLSGNKGFRPCTDC